MSGVDANPPSAWALDDVPAAAMLVWCEALRDDNAIHVDPMAAEKLGFGPRTVNPGPANLAYLMNMVMIARPDAHLRAVEAAFMGNVLAGDDVCAVGAWSGDEGAKSCEARLTSGPDAQPVLAAKISLTEHP